MHVFVAQDAIVIHRVKGLQCNRLQLPLIPFIAGLQTAYIHRTISIPIEYFWLSIREFTLAK